MIARVLVANRGEIAVRVIRACHRLGVEAVVVHSDPDADSMAVELADGAVALAGSTAADTYLDVDRVVGAALASGCDAVHPGYGFLAERADFATAVGAASLTWIGPAAAVIATMGDKLAARQVALDAGVPPVPGAMFAVDDADAVRRFGDEFGWPLAVKAVHGGGGRGMRVVAGPGEVAESLAAAPPRGTVLVRAARGVRRALPRPATSRRGADRRRPPRRARRRRRPRLLDPTPLPEADRGGTRPAAAGRRPRPARRGERPDWPEQSATPMPEPSSSSSTASELFFLEMNTRIQVEHPVTELVAASISSPSRSSSPAAQRCRSRPEDVEPRGAAIEVRINAEDTTDGRFLPVPGTLHRFQPPAGEHVRVDTGYRTGDEIPAEYDNLIAKIAVWGADREEARRRALDALRELVVDGVPTTAPVAAAVLAHDDFRDRQPLDELADRPRRRRCWRPETCRCSAGGTASPASTTPVQRADGEAPAPAPGGGPARARAASGTNRRAGDGRVTAPMQGTVTTVDVEVGDAVTADTRVIALEAMKMENALIAGIDGVVTAVHVTVGPTSRRERCSSRCAVADAVRIDRRDGVGEIVLARPDRRNALDYAAVLELVAALAELDDDDDVGAVLIYGDGQVVLRRRRSRRVPARADDAGLRLPPRRRRLGRPDAGDPPNAHSRSSSRRTAMPWREGAASSPPPTWRSPPRARCSGPRRSASGCSRSSSTRRSSRRSGRERHGRWRSPVAVSRPTRRVGSVSFTESCRPLNTSTWREPPPRSWRTSARTPSVSASGSWRQVDGLPVDQATAFAQSVRGSFMTTPDFAEGLAAFAEKRRAALPRLTGRGPAAIDDASGQP